MQEAWRESDTSTIFGRARSPATDARDGSDDYAVLDLEVITRASAALKRRPPNTRFDGETQERLVASAFDMQSKRLGREAEDTFVAALAQGRACGAAWYGLGSLLHEHQHGGLNDEHGTRDERLAEAIDCALIAARYEPQHPRALVLLGDALNDLGEHREACRAWRAAEARGTAHWAALARPWLAAAATHPDGDTFGPREPLRSLDIGAGAVQLVRHRSGRTFTAERLASTPPTFLLRGFSSEAERDAILAAAIRAPLREVRAGRGRTRAMPSAPALPGCSRRRSRLVFALTLCSRRGLFAHTLLCRCRDPTMATRTTTVWDARWRGCRAP
jgi:tetratricopeptide (TPR) repeat protein